MYVYQSLERLSIVGGGGRRGRLLQQECVLPALLIDLSLLPATWCPVDVRASGVLYDHIPQRQEQVVLGHIVVCTNGDVCIALPKKFTFHKTKNGTGKIDA